MLLQINVIFLARTTDFALTSYAFRFSTFFKLICHFLCLVFPVSGFKTDSEGICGQSNVKFSIELVSKILWNITNVFLIIASIFVTLPI